MTLPDLPDGLRNADEVRYAERLKAYNLRLYRSSDGAIQLAGDWHDYTGPVKRDGVAASPALTNELYYLGCRMQQLMVERLRELGYNFPDYDPADPGIKADGSQPGDREAYTRVSDEVVGKLLRAEPIPAWRGDLTPIDWDKVTGVGGGHHKATAD